MYYILTTFLFSFFFFLTSADEDLKTITKKQQQQNKSILQCMDYEQKHRSVMSSKTWTDDFYFLMLNAGRVVNHTLATTSY